MDKENIRIWEQLGFDAYYITLLNGGELTTPGKTPLSSVRDFSFCDAVTLLARKRVMQ